MKIIKDNREKIKKYIEKYTKYVFYSLTNSAIKCRCGVKFIPEINDIDYNSKDFFVNCICGNQIKLKDYTTILYTGSQRKYWDEIIENTATLLKNNKENLKND